MNIHGCGAQIGPHTGVIPVRPKGDVFLASRLAEVPGVARGLLDPEGGGHAAQVVVQAEAFQPLERNIGVGLRKSCQDRFPVNAERGELSALGTYNLLVERTCGKDRMQFFECEAVRFNAELSCFCNSRVRRGSVQLGQFGDLEWRWVRLWYGLILNLLEQQRNLDLLRDLFANC